MCRPNAPRSTNQQETEALRPHRDQAKADRIPPPIGANQSPRRTSTDKRKQEGKPRCARRVNQSSPPMAPGPTTEMQQLSKPNRTEAKSRKKKNQERENSLLFGTEKRERRSRLWRGGRRGDGAAAVNGWRLRWPGLSRLQCYREFFAHAAHAPEERGGKPHRFWLQWRLSSGGIYAKHWSSYLRF